MIKSQWWWKRKSKKKIKKSERKRYREMDKFEKKDKAKRSLDIYYRLKKEKEQNV